MKYSDNFIRDINYFLKYRNVFLFDGNNNYSKQWVEVTCFNNKTKEIIEVFEYPIKVWETIFGHINTTESYGKFFSYKFITKSKLIINYDKNGIDGIEAFYKFDSEGKIYPTRHPNILKSLLKTKGAINLQIKQWSMGRADGTLPKIEFIENIKIQYNLPDWVIEAVENQKRQYYDIDSIIGRNESTIIKEKTKNNTIVVLKSENKIKKFIKQIINKLIKQWNNQQIKEN